MYSGYFANPADFTKYVLNEQNWIDVTMKYVELWCCLPPVGTEFYDEFRGRKGITTSTHPFLLQGACGEFYTASTKEVVTAYDLTTSESLTVAWLESKVQGGLINWFKVKRNYKARHKALLVPSWYTSEYFQDELKAIKGWESCNSPQVAQHGFGDYIVSPTRAKVNVLNCYMMNGVIFANTYEFVKSREGTWGVESNQLLQGRPDSLFG